MSVDQSEEANNFDIPPQQEEGFYPSGSGVATVADDEISNGMEESQQQQQQQQLMMVVQPQQVFPTLPSAQPQQVSNPVVIEDSDEPTVSTTMMIYY